MDNEIRDKNGKTLFDHIVDSYENITKGEKILADVSEDESWNKVEAHINDLKPDILKPLKPNDPVNHPSHYTFGKYEVIDVLEDWNLPPLLWQVLKYVARCQHKGNELQDLKKAQFYLNRHINNLEKKNDN